MNRFRKTLGLPFAVLLLVLAAGITFTVGWRPFIGPRTRALTARKFQSTPERLTRGEYLFPGLAYIVVYTIQDQIVELLRIYHGAQDWP
ncbi:MAG: type II toxin-antitoxin system RelE/ParE family toxin [Candidatus Sulfotelmatobacter sp.]